MKVYLTLLLLSLLISLAVAAEPILTPRTATDSCCVGLRGNVTGDVAQQVNMTDLTTLVNFLFVTFEPPGCVDEADVDGNGAINLTDITALVNFLFVSFNPPAACPFGIDIVGLQPDDDLVAGIASVPDTAAYRVVLWARTNRWYVQPFVESPYTHIEQDGTWASFTHPWERMVALLVDTSYVPGSVRDDHPALDPAVVAWDEYPEPSVRFITWGNNRWLVKTGDLVGPGPNYFTDDTGTVWLDESERLHLRINQREARWYCAEIVLDRSLGYGVYSFQLDSRVDNLDYNTIFAGFIYETLNREFDFEFSQRLADPFNAQYVAQPWYTPGNIEFYDMPAAAQTSHSFEWRADSIVCRSWRGHADAPTVSTLIHSWTYTGPDIPPPGNERMRFNLYLYGGDAPVSGLGNEVIVTSFEYTE